MEKLLVDFDFQPRLQSSVVGADIKYYITSKWMTKLEAENHMMILNNIGGLCVLVDSLKNQVQYLESKLNEKH